MGSTLYKLYVPSMPSALFPQIFLLDFHIFFCSLYSECFAFFFRIIYMNTHRRSLHIYIQQIDLLYTAYMHRIFQFNVKRKKKTQLVYYVGYILYICVSFCGDFLCHIYSGVRAVNHCGIEQNKSIMARMSIYIYVFPLELGVYKKSAQKFIRPHHSLRIYLMFELKQCPVRILVAVINCCLLMFKILDSN